MDDKSHSGTAPGVDADSARDLPGWRDLIRQRFVTLDIDHEGHEPFRGTVDSTMVGPLAVSDVRSVPQTFRRTRRLIDRDGADLLQVGFLKAGYAELEQDGRSCRIRPGTFAVYETSRPFRWTMGENFRLAVFTWPRRMIPLDDASSRALTARSLGEGRPAERVAGAVLRELGTEGAGLGSYGETRLSALVADLVLTAAGSSGETDVCSPKLLQVALTYIEDNLSDPGLCPETVAQELHISVRSLQRLFAHSGRTVARWIRLRRLEKAYKELSAGSGRSVSAVAAASGFPDLTVFGRLFRSEYGVSPTGFRQGNQHRSVANTHSDRSCRE